MKIAALLGLSSQTAFVNDGNRFNAGKSADIGTFERFGYIVGMVGPRLEKPNVMEWQDIVITKEQNTRDNGYGRHASPDSTKTQFRKLWQTYYQKFSSKEISFPTFDEVNEGQTSSDFPQINAATYFNIPVYEARIQSSAFTLLGEANYRAQQANQQAYVHVVGLGLGVWGIVDFQAQLYADTFGKVLKDNPNLWPHIADIDLSWIPVTRVGKYFDGETTEGGIKVHISKRDPQAKLRGTDETKLLVVSFAWDSNSYPGNEYWIGSLSASGDPAAASCSLISELFNPEIHPAFSGDNLQVLTVPTEE